MVISYLSVDTALSSYLGAVLLYLLYILPLDTSLPFAVRAQVMDSFLKHEIVSVLFSPNSVFPPLRGF